MDLLKIISNGLMLSETDTRSYIKTIPRRYKVYTIKKRNSEETRLIAHPSKQVKTLQRAFLKYFKNHIPVHHRAYAYETGKSIRANAIEHSRNAYLLKMDFKNFFLSIKPPHFINLIKKHGINLSESDEFIITHLFFWKRRSDSPLRLSVGAPSSPFISNAVMYFFDEVVSSTCEKLDITYTRYADDLTFSTNKSGVLFGIRDIIKSILKSVGLSNIKINAEKTVFSSKKFNRHVTGVTISNEGAISLGRERKRLISARLHKFKNKELSESEILKLKGELGFAKFIEPTFIARMAKKYGEELIVTIQKFNVF
ncbi:retron St85 family RNA-directed DNA polymerase [Yersinia enterocolitica]|uniref:retron St85 family RNA-directed DNA polymerase n=1 Tax=Yersinia enterocolitica TaxID=630 RepID=UPI00398C8991